MTTIDATGEQLRLIVDSATDYAILSTDLTGRVVTWSSGAERLLLHRAAEIQGRSVDVIFTPEDQAAGAPDRERATALREGRAEDERWHQRRDGSRFWASGLQMPLRDDHEVVGFVKIIRDRTAQRETETALREATHGLRLAMDAGRMAIWNMDLLRDKVQGSPELNRVLGFPPDARPTLEDIRSRYAPGERDRLVADVQAALQRGDRSLETEFRFIRPDGNEHWLLLRAEIRLDDSGIPIRAIGVVMDIDDRKRAELAVAESEERFRLIADSAPVMLWMGDERARCVYLNRVQREFWGVPEEEVASFDWATTIHPEDRPLLRDAILPAMVARAPYTVEGRYRRAADGEWRLLRTDARPRFDGAGRFLGMTGVNVDVTDARRAESDLQALNATLEDRVREAVAERARAEEVLRQSQKMEAVGQLTGGIAHDFNNMMAVVIGGLNLLGRALARGETDVSRYIDAAMDGATRAAALTQRLLAFSRQQPLSPEPLDPNALVEGMTELLARTLGENVQVRTGLAPEIWATRADRVQLESALLNLAVNARDAMPDGGHLLIESRNETVGPVAAREFDIAAGDYVILSVSDTGEGMTPEIIGQVFDPFFTTKAVGKGTGLGLSQVFGFVRQSGGHVRIQSAPGQGTTLRIYLPRFAGGSASQTAETPALRPEDLRGNPREIVMVVEDEARVRSYSVEALRELGYTVVHASGGLEALRMIDEGQDVSLLFTDVVMPEMTGRQLADQALQRLPELRVLFTTGYTRDAVIRNGMLAAGTAVLTKPFGIDQLAERVRAALTATPAGASAQEAANTAASG